MKKTVVGVLLAFLIWQFLIMFLTGAPFLKNFENSVIASLPEYENSECYYSEGFQDFTNYFKYYFTKDDIEKIKDNNYLKPVTEDSIAELNGYFDNFESWIAFVDYKEKYDFKRDIIDTDDYFYIENDETTEEQKYWDYNIYFFDTQTQVLYFMHSNI